MTGVKDASTLDLMQQAVTQGRSERLPDFVQFTATRHAKASTPPPFTVTKSAVRMPKK
jgi:hypothetical protein